MLAVELGSHKQRERTARAAGEGSLGSGPLTRVSASLMYESCSSLNWRCSARAIAKSVSSSVDSVASGAAGTSTTSSSGPTICSISNRYGQQNREVSEETPTVEIAKTINKNLPRDLLLVALSAPNPADLVLRA